MPARPEVLHQHHAQPVPCAPMLDEKMAAIASSIGQKLVCDLLVDVRAAGGTPNDLLGFLARVTASSVQFCFRREDHEVALRRLNLEVARLLKAER